MAHNLDVLDKKLLYFLDLNSRMTLSELSKKTRASQQTLLYRIKRLEEIGIINRYVSLIEYHKIGYFGVEIYYQFQNMTPEEEDAMVDFLNEDERVIWIARCHGKYGLVIAILAKDIFEFDAFQKEVLSKYGKFISEKTFSIQKKVYPLAKRYLWKEGMQKETDEMKVGDNTMLTVIDSKLLYAISQNARASIRELSQKTSTPPNTINYHLKKLIQSGIIYGFRLDLNLEKLGFERHHLLIHLNESTSKKKEHQFVAFCKEHTSISYLIECVGNWEYEIEIDVKNLSELNTIVMDIKKVFGEIIKNIESLQILNEPKNDYWPVKP